MYTLTDVRPSCWVSSEPGGGNDVWTANMTKGVDVCVECQPTAMRSKLGGRCQGQVSHNDTQRPKSFRSKVRNGGLPYKVHVHLASHS